MKVKLTKPTHVYCEVGEVNVSEAEANRLFMLGCCELITEKEVEKKERTETKQEIKKGKK